MTDLAQIHPPAVIESEAMGQAAIDLLKLRRRFLENEYELQLQQAQRAKLRAERDGIELRLQNDTLTGPDRRHLKARIMEIDAKVWKSKELTTQFQLELKVYKQLLRP